MYLSITSANWNTVRIKLPEEDMPSWRVEFRVLEIQPCDHDNLMLLEYSYALVRAITRMRPMLLVPISLVDANMETGHAKNAMNSKLF